MTNEQMQALKKIEQMLKEGKISSVGAHARRNAIGAGIQAFREQFPDEADSVAPKSALNKMKMPPAAAKQEEE
jgi:hypothetical protein